MQFSRGLTILEVIISVAILVLVAGIGLYMLNPAGQLAKARNSQRLLHVTAILGAIRQNIADKNTGVFNCVAGDIPTSTKRMASSGTSTFNIAPCLIPTYLTTLPFDPSTSTAHYNTVSDYDTGYLIVKNASSQIVISAPAAELGQVIGVTR